MRGVRWNGLQSMGLKARITTGISCFLTMVILLFFVFSYGQARGVYLNLLDSALITWGEHVAGELNAAFSTDESTQFNRTTPAIDFPAQKDLAMGFVVLKSGERLAPVHSAYGTDIPSQVMSALVAEIPDSGVGSRPHSITSFGLIYRVLVLPSEDPGLTYLACAPIQNLMLLGGKNLLWRFVLLGSLLVVLATIGGYLFTGYILSPIDALRQVSHRIANGNLDEGVELTGSYELVSLSESINHMRLAISEMIHDSDAKKAELESKGTELYRTNRELERAIFQANEMAAVAEIRNYEMEHEVVQRRKAEEGLRTSEEKYRTIVENIREGYCEVSSTGVITFVNQAMVELTGYSTLELVGKHRGELIEKESRDHVLDAFRNIFQGEEETSELDYPITRKDGQQLHVGVSVTLMHDGNGKRVGFRTIVRDVEARKRYEEELIYMAYHDPLTGLKNRKGFYEKLESNITRAKRYSGQVGLLYIDVDRFKVVNDTLGHEAGDAVLKEITRRLTDNLRQSDCVARIGGDEFAVVLDGDDNLDITVVTRKVAQILAAPYEVGGQRIDYISGSVGVALFPEDAVTAGDLVRFADAAMYELKRERQSLDTVRGVS